MKKNKKNTTPKPAPIWTMRITAYSDGTMNVAGFSKNFHNAMRQLDSTRDTIVGAFLDAAKDNRLSDNMVIDESNIIKPKKGLFVRNVG